MLASIFSLNVIQTALELGQYAAILTAENRLRRRQQDATFATGLLFRRMAEHEPRQFLGIRHLRRRDKTDARTLCRTGHFHPRFDGQILAHGKDVEARIVDRPLKVDDAALDTKLLPIGVEASAHRAGRTAGAR